MNAINALVRRKICIQLLIIILLISLMGCAGDPISDLYTSNVYPGTTNTYQVGSPVLQYLNGYFQNVYINGSAVVAANVTSITNLDDNAVIRGDGGALGVQDSGVTIDDFDNLNTNGGDLTGFDINAGNDVNVTNDLDVTDNGNIDGTLTVGEDVGIGIAIPTARLHLDAGTAGAGTAPLKFDTGTLLGTPEAGVMEYDGTGIYLTNTNHRRFISQAADSIITPVTISNNATEITVFTGVLNSNELKAHRVYRLSLYGEMSTASAADTITIRVKINGTTLIDLTSDAGVATDEPTHAQVVFTVRSTGIAGAVSSYCDLYIASKETHINTSSIAIDTTIINNITATFQWSAAKVDNIATLDQSFLEVLD